MVTGMSKYLGLENGQSKEESLELGFELSQNGDILQTVWQRIPGRWSDETKRVLPKDFELCFGMLKTFSLTPSYLVS